MGWHASRHPRAGLQRLPGAGGPPPRGAGRGLRPVPATSSTRAASPSPPSPPARAGLSRRVRPRTPGSARPSASRSARSRRSPSRSPTWRSRVETARLACHGPRAARPGQPFKPEAAIAKLYATEAAVTAARDAARSSAATATWRSPGRPLLPRRQGPRDRRGHQRDPAPRHRPLGRALVQQSGPQRPGRRGMGPPEPVGRGRWRPVRGGGAVGRGVRVPCAHLARGLGCSGPMQLPGAVVRPRVGAWQRDGPWSAAALGAGQAAVGCRRAWDVADGVGWR